MPKQVIGKIPEFTDGGSPEVTGQEEEKELTEETLLDDKDNQTELPAENKPADNGEDNDDREVIGLSKDRDKLLAEIRTLRQQRREMRGKDVEPLIVQQNDTLEDIDPEYTQTVERIMKAKGYVTKNEAAAITYETVKKSKLDEFLEKYPEYKPENDPDDINWNALQRELQYYRTPADPNLFSELLLKAHKTISKSSSGTVNNRKKLDNASFGSGGNSKPASHKTLTSSQKDALLRGGWSEEDIADLEK